MTKKQKLTLNDHRGIGTDLKKMNLRMGEIWTRLHNGMDRKSQGVILARRIYDDLSKLRSLLETSMGKELPEIRDLSDEEFLDVYYGKAEKRESTLSL